MKIQGDQVSQGESLVEIEVSKATQDVEAPVTGVLSKILVEPGAVVAVNAELAIIED